LKWISLDKKFKEIQNEKIANYTAKILVKQASQFATANRLQRICWASVRNLILLCRPAGVDQV
jgi:hypothetical protein